MLALEPTDLDATDTADHAIAELKKTTFARFISALAVAQRSLLCVGSTTVDFSSNQLSGVVLEELASSTAAAMSESIKWLEQAGEELALQV